MKLLPHDISRTVCNPMPLPDYPRGRLSRTKKPGAFGYLQTEQRDWRETADPSVLYHGGRWYLYPSCGMAWVSEDFATWQHHRIEPYDPGYAPTIVLHRDRFLMTACSAGIFSAPSPLGPFSPLGVLTDVHGRPVQGFNDPMLFSDDDGRLYAYWGLGEPGIFGAEVDPVACNRLLTEPKILFRYDADQRWERYGEYNEDVSQSYIEGPWMVKIKGTYYLTYAGPGTEWRTYAMGACKSIAPLGPFVRQQRNPFCAKTDGMVQGPGHGCVVCGPGETIWAFYTCRVCYEHIFERRIGFDPAGVDAAGDLYVSVSEFPQWAPGVLPRPELGNDTSLRPVNHRRRVIASSEAPGRCGLYAVDNCLHTWWQPAADDARPVLEQQLASEFSVSALRLVWRDVGLDYDAGRLPGPFRWRLETADAAGTWSVAVDAAANTSDLLVDYRTFPERQAKHLRLRILDAPAGITPGLSDISLFGRSR